jgi:hypothetical protein
VLTFGSNPVSIELRGGVFQDFASFLISSMCCCCCLAHGCRSERAHGASGSSQAVVVYGISQQRHPVALRPCDWNRRAP